MESDTLESSQARAEKHFISNCFKWYRSALLAPYHLLQMAAESAAGILSVLMPGAEAGTWATVAISTAAS